MEVQQPTGRVALGAVPEAVLELLSARFPGCRATLLSQTHHVVVRVGEHLLAKFGNEPGWRPDLEAALLSHSGVDCELTNADGTPVIIMENAGEDITPKEYGKSLDLIAETLHTLHSSYDLSPLNLPVLSGERLSGRVTRRIGPHTPGHIRDWFAQAIEKLPPVPNGGASIAHTDPHPGNWVHRGAALRLIDWESACRTHPEADIAGVLHACTVRGMDPEPFLAAYGEHDEGTRNTLLTLKSISATSHQLWAYGVEAFEKRRREILPILRRRWDLPLPE